eukprot:scaffold99429_cov36-Phaeocystis_antarctica.AAC.1
MHALRPRVPARTQLTFDQEAQCVLDAPDNPRPQSVRTPPIPPSKPHCRLERMRFREDRNKRGELRAVRCVNSKTPQPVPEGNEHRRHLPVRKGELHGMDYVGAPDHERKPAHPAARELSVDE